MRESPYTSITRRLRKEEAEIEQPFAERHKRFPKRRALSVVIAALLVLYILFGGVVIGTIQTPAVFQSEPALSGIVLLLNGLNTPIAGRCLIVMFISFGLTFVLEGWFFIMSATCFCLAVGFMFAATVYQGHP
jgi:hypothetical protein